jgi:cytochrome b561
MAKYQEYVAWDVPTRWFHWINAIGVIGLIASGLVLLSDDALGLSPSGKILLKSVHVSVGYAMAANLLMAFCAAKSLFDHLFGTQQDRLRHRQTKCLGGLDVNSHLKFDR